MCNETFQGVRARILLKNIMYAGVLAALLDLEVMKPCLAKVTLARSAVDQRAGAGDWLHEDFTEPAAAGNGSTKLPAT
jgi:hypothetical protein